MMSVRVNGVSLLCLQVCLSVRYRRTTGRRWPVLVPNFKRLRDGRLRRFTHSRRPRVACAQTTCVTCFTQLPRPSTAFTAYRRQRQLHQRHVVMATRTGDVIAWRHIRRGVLQSRPARRKTIKTFDSYSEKAEEIGRVANAVGRWQHNYVVYNHSLEG